MKQLDVSHGIYMKFNVAEDSMREHVSELANALAECGEERLAVTVRAAAEGSDSQFEAFLLSNELWGGAGSIADQAGLSHGRTDCTRMIQAALIKLGTAQLQAGRVNVRTASWVSAFREWARRGI